MLVIVTLLDLTGEKSENPSAINWRKKACELKFTPFSEDGELLIEQDHFALFERMITKPASLHAAKPWSKYAELQAIGFERKLWTGASPPPTISIRLQSFDCEFFFLQFVDQFVGGKVLSSFDSKSFG